MEAAAREDADRLWRASELAGVVYVGCDTSDALAEAVLAEQAARQQAEQELRDFK